MNFSTTIQQNEITFTTDALKKCNAKACWEWGAFRQLSAQLGIASRSIDCLIILLHSTPDLHHQLGILLQYTRKVHFQIQTATGAGIFRWQYVTKFL